MDEYTIGECSFKNGYTRAADNIFNELDDLMWNDEIRLTIEEYERLKNKIKSDYNYLTDEQK